VYARVLERRIRLIVVEPQDSGGTMQVFVLVVEHWTSSIPSTGCLRFHGEGIRPCPSWYPVEGCEGTALPEMMLSCWLYQASQDLQYVLHECEAAGMRISTSKSEAMVLDQKRVAPQQGGWALP
ncbi:hypothetical protein L3Q82_018844, partial [Scortum barcoo]